MYNVHKRFIANQINRFLLPLASEYKVDHSSQIKSLQLISLKILSFDLMFAYRFSIICPFRPNSKISLASAKQRKRKWTRGHQYIARWYVQSISNE